MSEETHVTVRVDAPPEWGSREEIYALAKRIQAILPGNLTTEQSLLLAQYGFVMDANVARGEIYAYESRGKLILTEGYKLLVRWARRQCNFYERYERITNDTDIIPEGAFAFRCRLLRQDAVEDLATLTQAGVPNAYELCSTEAVGIVRKEEMWSKKYNKPIDPPKTWTWEQVARKNALKNALRIAYGAPSPREIAAESWMIDDIETAPEDWSADVVTPIHVQELDAKYSAQRRLLAAERAARPARSTAEDIAELWGEEIAEQPVEPKEVEKVLGGEPEGVSIRAERDVDTIKNFGDLWAACQEDFGLNRSQALRELGVTKQEHLGAREPREFYQQIAATRYVEDSPDVQQ